MSKSSASNALSTGIQITTNSDGFDDLNAQSLSVCHEEDVKLKCEKRTAPASDTVMSEENEVQIAMNDVSEPLAASVTVDLNNFFNNNFSPTKNIEKPANTAIKFRDKEFKIRPSLLTSLYETDARVIYNISLALFFLATSALWIQDYSNTGNPFNHFWLIYWNFSQLPLTMCCWSLMFASTIAFSYYGLTIWSRLPSENISVSTKIALSLAYACYIFSLFYYPLRFIFYWKLSPACSFVITCENSRLAMKVHSFIRENYDRAVQRKSRIALNKEKSDESLNEWPSIEQFIYYLFCPSFLYRDSYPRAEKRCWGLVARYGIQCLVAIYLLNATFILIVHPVFSTMDYEHGVSFGVLAFSMFQSIIPGVMSMFAIFYGLLHSWMNMFAEMLRFGDRCFYSNWWSSKNMADYYRKWNIIVHEWLYVYVYRDFTLILGEKWGPRISQISVFFLSAVFHEYWFGVSLGVFYPVIFFMYFICGGAFFLIAGKMKHSQMGNTIMWFNLLFGTSLFYAVYAPEFYARQRCPKVNENDIIDLITPRIWSCMKA